MTKTMTLAIGSIVVGLTVLALKAAAWWVTGSVAVLSDALESTVNLATAVAALIAIRIAALPADANHPYGHHKAEFFSALLEGVMIAVAAILILKEALAAFLAPRLLDAPLEGLALVALATVLNGVWSWVLITRGRRERSPALVADGKHLVADVVSSVGVMAGVTLAVASGAPLVDPAVATLVAGYILWSGWKAIRDSSSGLLDESVPEETLRVVRSVIGAEATGAVEAHDLRTRHAGRATFIEFHLVMPGETTVQEAHDVCDRVEAALKAHVPDSVITIHIEPETKAKHSGIVVL